MKIRIVLLVFFALGCELSAQTLYTLDLKRFKEAKHAYNKGKETDRAILKLISEANKYLKDTSVYSVVFKQQVPPNGDKHSYMSLSPYWWPDSTKANGLPYIQKDGETNPESKKYPDNRQLNKMCRAVKVLGLSYYISGKKEYADKANQLLRAWFIDSATRMNPSMEYAQAVIGRNTGKASGVLETKEFIDLLDIVELLRTKKGIDNSLYKGLQQWFSAYKIWLDTSKIAQDERKAANNHGSWFAAQYARYAIFIGDKKSAGKILGELKNRIASQIEPDGKQPLELTRTKSLGYSMFNLKALCTASLIAEKIGINLWQYHTSDGRSLKKALDYILPYAFAPDTWPEQQIAPVNKKDLTFLLVVTVRHYPKDPQYKIWLQQMQNKDDELD